MVNENIIEENSYEKAVKNITDFIQINNSEYTYKDEDERLYRNFQRRFSPEVLKNLSDDKLLNYMFLHDGNQNNLCYALEFDKNYGKFGSIKGGSAYKFKLFKHKVTGKWMYGSSPKHSELSDDEALEKAREIRDVLVKGAEIIESNSLENESDYEILDLELNYNLKTINMTSVALWIHKYYSMIFPDKFTEFHNEKLQDFFLNCFKIKPSSKVYGRSGQLALLAKRANISTKFFGQICWEKFGSPDNPKLEYKKIREDSIGMSDSKCYNFDDDIDWEDLVNRKPMNLFCPNNESVKIKSWNNLYLHICEFVFENNRKELESKIDNNELIYFSRNIFSKDKNNFIPSATIEEVGNSGIYTDTKLSAFDLFKKSKEVISELGYNLNEWKFTLVSDDKENNCAKNVWLLSPGENAEAWNDFKENNLIAIGRGMLGDLSKYNDSEEIRNALKEYYPNNYSSESNPYNDAKCLLDFPKEMKIGDLVFIKKGIKKLLGLGIVCSDYKFLKDSLFSGADFNNVREVQWIKTDDNGEFDVPSSINSLPVKTLTNVSYYDNYCFSLANALGLQLDEYLCKDTLLNVFSKSKKLYNLHKDIVRNSGYGRSTPFKFFFEGDIKKYLDNNYEKIDKSYNDKVIKLFDDFINKDIIIEETYTKENFLKEVVFIEKEYDKLVNLIKRKKNIILQGSPGVGKTFIAKRLAYSMMGEKDENRVEFVQFHQSYSYEDFIQGYRPSGDGFELNNGVFYNFCRKASEDPDNAYYFIIDEINRGNISKIFGELMMLIEEDKRGKDFGIHLTYSDKGPRFYVPENVYIIGMMNTADRSLAIIDYALRRRFVFYLLPPLFDEDSENDNIFKNHLIEIGVDEDLAIKIISKFKVLNNRILDDEDLGYGFRIGHAYFCGKGTKNKQWFRSIINYEIAPLLKEYWFDDLEKAEEEIEKLLNI